jgi:hypothetical protein
MIFGRLGIYCFDRAAKPIYFWSLAGGGARGALHCRRPRVGPLFLGTVGERIPRTFRGRMWFPPIRDFEQAIEIAGAPDKIRTCDLCLRRAALYPAELRAREAVK